MPLLSDNVVQWVGTTLLAHSFVVCYLFDLEEFPNFIHLSVESSYSSSPISQFICVNALMFLF